MIKNYIIYQDVHDLLFVIENEYDGLRYIFDLNHSVDQSYCGASKLRYIADKTTSHYYGDYGGYNTHNDPMYNQGGYDGGYGRNNKSKGKKKGRGHGHSDERAGPYTPNYNRNKANNGYRGLTKSEENAIKKKLDRAPVEHAMRRMKLIEGFKEHTREQGGESGVKPT